MLLPVLWVMVYYLTFWNSMISGSLLSWLFVLWNLFFEMLRPLSWLAVLSAESFKALKMFYEYIDFYLNLSARSTLPFETDWALCISKF